jgi:predicted metal-dependent HD superfamily phosphohydrolase
MQRYRSRFSRCWLQIGGRDAPLEVLARCYAEPQRAYHNAEHLEECLAWWDASGCTAARSAELELALFFHDAVYDPRATDNEARSALLLRSLAATADSEAVARIEALVLSTARHDVAVGDAALLSDIDLSILGAPPARYARFERAIRQEYAHVDDASYARGRARVLRGFLERLGIYRTPFFGARLEAQARNNLAHALASLT